MTVRITEVEISPEAHHAYLTGAYANERLIVEALRRERDVLIRKQKALEDRIAEAEQVALRHLYGIKKLEQQYDFNQKPAGTITTAMYGCSSGRACDYFRQ